MNGFQDFYTYIAKNVRYPTKARDNLITGRLIATFDVINGKIDNVKISRELDEQMDQEVLRVLKGYDIKLPPGYKNLTHYAIPVSFEIIGKNGNQVGDATKTADGKPVMLKLSPIDPQKTYTLDEVVVTSYVSK